MTPFMGKMIGSDNVRMQPKGVNPYLWRRFLEKKGYDGTYTVMGITIRMIHTKRGILELIN